MNHFLSLRDDMTSVSFSSVYDPCVSVDLVGRGAIYSGIMKVYQKLIPSAPTVATAESADSSETPKVSIFPARCKGGSIMAIFPPPT